MRVLVTGGTGYLGSAVVRAVEARGHTPVVFARSADRAIAPGSRAEAARGDIRDRERLAEAARGCDAVVHTAAIVSVGRPRPADFDDVNVGGLENVLAVASALRIRRIVYTSSFLALAPQGASSPIAFNDYQRTKVAADRVAHRAASTGTAILIMYPGVIYGPGPLTEGNLVGRSLADHVAGRLPGIIGAARVWSYAYVDDVADAHAAALQAGTPGERYLLGGENAAQMRPFEILRDRLGRPLPRRIPFVVAAALGCAEQMRAALLRTSPILTPGTARILARDWPLDSSLAERDLGYRPRPLAEGLAPVLAQLARSAGNVP